MDGPNEKKVGTATWKRLTPEGLLEERNRQQNKKKWESSTSKAKKW